MTVAAAISPQERSYRRAWFSRYGAYILAPVAFLLAVATYAALSGEGGMPARTPRGIMALLLIDLAFLALLITVVASRTVGLWRALRSGKAGSRLQIRIVGTFSLVTILPAAVVSIFSAFFFNLGIQAWFNERVNTTVEEALAVAEAYVREHRENIRADVIAMAHDLNRELPLAQTSPADFQQIVETQTVARSLTEVVVFQRHRIIAQGRLSFALAFERMPQDMIERAERGEIVIITTGDEDKVRALVRLDAAEPTYLLVGRLIEGRVIGHMEKTQGAVTEYRELRANLARMQVTFSVVYVALTLLLLLAVIWYGMVFASRLIAPISRLAGAAERVRAGDFAVKVETGPRDDEIGTLERAFNRMTGQLEAQRGELIEANRRLDERRRFTEAVLAGVSAGVLALDAGKRVTLCNRSAEALLVKGGEGTPVGKPVHEALPGLSEILAGAEQQRGQEVHDTVTATIGGKPLTLHVRAIAEWLDNRLHGFIVTFDDITLLVAAQRNAAWADVARRVAHEIKNPLTPIQLATERLKKKYLKLLGDEGEGFLKYTDTIARHVADIGRMVEEFVSFARMPMPVFKHEELGGVLKKSLFSAQCAHPDITFELEVPEDALWLVCDERQISQVLTNLMKNAAEGVEARQSADADAGRDSAKGRIILRLRAADGRVEVEVIDNGTGFPPGQIEKMLEPYVTTRSKGTGLGLAIVKKIMEDHEGSLQLENMPGGGACVRLSFYGEHVINPQQGFSGGNDGR